MDDQRRLYLRQRAIGALAEGLHRQDVCGSIEWAEFLELLDSEASLRAKLEKAEVAAALFRVKGTHDTECHPSEFRHTAECIERKKALADYESIK